MGALGWLSVGVITLSVTCFAKADTNSYCRTFIDNMESETLYSAECNRVECLKKVVQDSGIYFLQSANDGKLHALKKAQKYSFIFKTQSDGVSNSAVVIQVKQLDEKRRDSPRPSSVRLQREKFDFACVGREQSTPLPQWPPIGVKGRDLPAIAYDRYDQFHRDGFTSQHEDRILRERFHFRYFNGDACVSTYDPLRRAQLLYHDQDKFSGRLASFFISLGAPGTKANAQQLDDIQKYERLKTLVSSYARKPNSAGCFGFSTKAGRHESVRLDITVRDIERQVSSYPFDLSKTWSFALQ